MVGTDKVEAIRALAGQAGPSKDSCDKRHPPPTPAPKKATPRYPLGTAKVDALVSPTADHLDVSVTWKKRQRCIT